MLSIKKARELLGDKYKALSDEEVEKIRDELYKFGHLIFDSWLAEQSKKRKNRPKKKQ